MNDKNKNILIPVIAIFLGFLSGVIIMVITGQDPSILFKSIIRAVTGINVEKIGSRDFLLQECLENTLYMQCL